jgi:hypothetical protein
VDAGVRTDNAGDGLQATLLLKKPQIKLQGSTSARVEWTLDPSTLHQPTIRLNKGYQHIILDVSSAVEVAISAQAASDQLASCHGARVVPRKPASIILDLLDLASKGPLPAILRYDLMCTRYCTMYEASILCECFFA